MIISGENTVTEFTDTAYMTDVDNCNGQLYVKCDNDYNYSVIDPLGNLVLDGASDASMTSDGKYLLARDNDRVYHLYEVK